VTTEDTPDPAAVAEEGRRVRELRACADLTCAILRQGRLSREEADALVAATRRRAVALFPGKEDVFDLVLAPRFRRIIDETRPASARVLRFPGGRRPAG
jgi:hypothetical protein